MGLMRKMTSISTGGLVDFRSDKERTAAYTKSSKKEAKKQTALMEQQAKDAKAAARAAKIEAKKQAELPVPPAASGASMADELERIAGLHQQGLLTDDEFAAAKAQLLS